MVEGKPISAVPPGHDFEVDGPFSADGLPDCQKAIGKDVVEFRGLRH
ncbi:MAG: hypothetical protein OXH69_13565 [Acidobacteria bacterium]|nr:hypothetical protein [Acidobacteriota bacterium]